MLTRLSVRRFKSLREVDVDLARLVVVFGPNAAGKSNLLEAILLLSRLVRERTIADAFDGAVRGYPLEAFTFGAGGMEGLLAQAEATLELGADVGAGAEALRYDVEVAIRPATGELALTNERLSRASPKAKPTIERVPGDSGPELRVRRKDKQSHPIVERPGLNHTLASNRQFDAQRFPDIDRLRAELAT